MRLLLVCFYWFLISLHVVGGAVLFRRLFPRESAWFGLVVPTLALILGLNFVEHCVGLPSLLALLPFTALGSIVLIIDPGTRWRGLRLPIGIFLVAFAATLALRVLKPNVLAVSSGKYDLPVISSFCMGQKLPPSFCWFPMHPMGQYYAFVHYSASVLIRLLDVDIGTGFNLSSALLSAWLCVLAAGIAWRVSRQSVWITIAAALMIECAANGSSAYFWLSAKDLDPIVTTDMFIAKDDAGSTNPVLKLLQPVNDVYDRRELQIPGFWSWLGTYHATNGGQFFSLFAVLSLVELLRRKRSNWPWIGLIASPVLMLVTSTWGVPLVGVLMVAGIVVAFCHLWRPQNIRLVLGVLTGMAILMAPMLIDLLPCAIPLPEEQTGPDSRTQLTEFLIYWWPIYVPWLTVLFVWRRLPPAVKVIHLLLPLAFWQIENITVAARTDMTGKLWGYLWGMGWCVLFPVVAMRRGVGFRILTAILLVSNLISLYSWIDWTRRTTGWGDDVLIMEGTGILRADPVKAKMLELIAPMKNQILLTGLPSWCCTDCPTMASFTANYAYIGASFYAGNFFCPGTADEAVRRDGEVVRFYAGKIDKPFNFLRYRDIAVVVIWPDDNVPDAVVENLKRQLAPAYEYQDFREGAAANAGLFIYRRHLDLLSGDLPPVPSPPVVPSPGAPKS